VTDTDFKGLVCGARAVAKAEFDARARRVAAGLRDFGIVPGDAVALLLRNDIAVLEASFGARALGAYAVPINWHLVGREVAYIIEDCGARVLIAHADLLNAVADAVPAGIEVVVVPDAPDLQAVFRLSDEACAMPPGARVWDDWIAGLAPIEELYDEIPDSMIYTSGTTGMPKGVRRLPQTREGLAHTAEARSRINGVKPGMRTVIPGPLYHSAPNGYGLLSAHVADLTVVMPRFDAEGMLALIDRYKLSGAIMAPTMFIRLLKLPEEVRAKYDVSSMRFVIHAAAPCPTEIKRAMIDWWGPVINEFYGSTEVGHVTFCDSEEALAKPGTVGKRCPGTVAKALDDEGNEQPVGVPGEIYGRVGHFHDFTYHNMPDEWAKLDRDGLVATGDVGYFDEDGYLFLCDRKRDMVISGGVNIYPAEIEAVLVGMPEVADCAVFGIPDAEFGEKLMAVVQPHGGAAPSAGEIKAYLRERLAGYKVPRLIELREKLPRDDSGKIYKRLLRDPYWQDHETRI